MMDWEFINRLSVGSFFASIILILLLVSFLSFYLGKRNYHKGPSDSSEFISTNILGLLALILGFSFSMEIERYESRRLLALEEANTVSTAYLRSETINFPSHEEVKNLFKKYIGLRVAAYESPEPTKFFKDIELVKGEIWESFVKVTARDRGELESAYMQSLNEMFDTGNTRTKALMKMMPISFYLLILMLAATAVGFINYDRGQKSDNDHGRSIVFVILFSIVFVFIFDMDHPRRGLINISQAPLIEVQQQIP